MSISRILLIFLVLISLGYSLFITSFEQPAHEHSFAFETMGTEASCNLMLPPDMTGQEAENIVRSTFSKVNTALSTWSANSEISKLNRAPSDSGFTVSSLLKECLLVSGELQKKSRGAFDPTAESLMRLWGFYQRKGVMPTAAELASALSDLGHWHLDKELIHIIKDKPGTRFDLGGIAKGLAVDLAADQLLEAGIRDGLIDLGGNLFCLGGATDRNDWRVGIRNPHNRDELFASVTISNEAVATSGSYERFVTIDGHQYGHIMNPATGLPAEGILSATVIAPQGHIGRWTFHNFICPGPGNGSGFFGGALSSGRSHLDFPW